jgi:hypothetical protein
MGLALLATVAGCGLVHDHSPQTAPLGMGSSEAACLAGSAELWHEYFEGRADRARIDGFFTCAEDSLRLFTERTRGARQGEYSPGELKTFLQTYFLAGYPVRDQLVSEVMYLKQVTLGGRADLLTTGDFDQVKHTLEILRDNVRRLQPYMPLTPEHAAELPDEIFRDEVRAIRRAAGELGAAFQKSGLSYSFAHLDSLLHEIEYFYPGEGPHQLRGRMDLIRVLKGALLAPGADAVGPGQWISVFVSGAEWYVLSLRAARLARRFPDWFTGSGRRRLVLIAHSAAELIKAGVARQQDGEIPFATLDTLIDALRDGELVDSRLAAHRDVLKQFLRPLLTRGLGGPVNGRQGRGAQGLTLGAMDRIEASLDRWANVQAALESAFGAAARAHGIGPDHALSTGFTVEELLRALPVPPSRNTVLAPREEAAGALRMMIATTPPIFGQGGPEVGFRRGLEGQKYSYRGLSRRVWIRELVRFMLQGYASDPERAEAVTGVNQPEFHCFTDDIRKIGIVLGIVDERKYDMHYKRFREARLFMYASDGDEYLNLPETEQLLDYLLSADEHTRRLHEEIAKRCRTYGEDPFGYSRVDAECFRSEYFGHPEETWRYMPELARYYLSLRAKDRERFEWLLETSARMAGFSTAPIESEDTQGYALVAQYVETLFMRFDRNGDGVIDGHEEHAAFAVFQGILSDVVRALLSDPKLIQKMTQPKNLEALFTYLLAHGKAPDTDSISGKIGFWIWMQRGPEWSIKADRMRLLEIFAQLGSSLASGGASAAQDEHSACWQD